MLVRMRTPASGVGGTKNGIGLFVSSLKRKSFARKLQAPRGGWLFGILISLDFSLPWTPKNEGQTPLMRETEFIAHSLSPGQSRRGKKDEVRLI